MLSEGRYSSRIAKSPCRTGIQRDLVSRPMTASQQACPNMEQQTKLTPGQISILLNACIKDMATWLMEDFEYSLEEALDCVYTSELLEKLQDLSTGLYYQSSGYNYELLKDEMKYGKIKAQN